MMIRSRFYFIILLLIGLASIPAFYEGFSLVSSVDEGAVPTVKGRHKIATDKRDIVVGGTDPDQDYQLEQESETTIGIRRAITLMVPWNRKFAYKITNIDEAVRQCANVENIQLNILFRGGRESVRDMDRDKEIDALIVDSIGNMKADSELDYFSLDSPRVFKSAVKVLWNTENWFGRAREWDSKYKVMWLNKTVLRNAGGFTPNNAGFWSHFNLVASFDVRQATSPQTATIDDIAIPYASMYQRFYEDYSEMRNKILPAAPATANRAHPLAIHIASNCHTDYTLRSDLRVSGHYFTDVFLGKKGNPVSPEINNKMPKHRMALVEALNRGGENIDNLGFPHPIKTTVFGQCGGHHKDSPEAAMRVNGCEGDLGLIHDPTILSRNLSPDGHRKKYYSPASLRKGCLMRRHLFYLSLENSISFDYVTEKLYEPLAVGGTIPVYLGAPNVADFAPADHSLINIADFETVEGLRKYLHCVSQNSTLIAYYRAWRERSPAQQRLTGKYSKRSGNVNFRDLSAASPLCDIARRVRSVPKDLLARKAKAPVLTSQKRCGWTSGYANPFIPCDYSQFATDQSPLPCTIN